VNVNQRISPFLATQEAVKLFRDNRGSNTLIFSELIGSDFKKQAVANTPFERFGQPNDIAKVSVFLVSNDSAWITCESISISGVLNKYNNSF
tara:strand:- start:6854 stop:7129 length:276 start_codon:yes stop_codon:yes gene_type:complete